MTTPPTTPHPLARAESILAAAGIEEARLDAELLLGYLLGLRRTEVRLAAREPLAPAVADAFDVLVARRARREPLAWILGRQEFLGLDLLCDRRALIPRWDSECLVERLAALLADRPRPLLADLGTGSGALAVGLASLLPGASVWATDCDPDALALAGENVARLGLADRVHLLLGDLAEPLVTAGLAGRLDGVIANPPYLPSPMIETLEPEVRDGDPRLALDGGPDGLRVIRRLLPALPGLLAPGGVAVVEHGWDQAAAVAALAGPAGLVPVEVVRDLGRRDRGTVLRCAG